MNSKIRNIILTSKDWKSFKKKVDKLNTTKEKGDAFELLSKCYLKTNHTHQSKLKDVWLLEEVKPSLLKKLNLPKDDKGIDLIAESFNGEYWAIQCKYKGNETKKTNFQELGTFISLSDSIGKNISYKLVCTTSDDYVNLLKATDNLGVLTSEIWNGLGKEDFQKFHAFLGNDKIKVLPKPYSPFAHQERAIKNAIKHFVKDKNERGKLILPCGAGKSLTGYWLGDKLKAKKIIIAVPSLALVRQTLNTWLREVVANKKNVDWICVCSDSSIGKQDDNAVFTKDLAIPCTTNKNQIAEWLSNNNKKTKVVFTTYQSGETIAEASQEANITFDLGIFDEAHKTVGRKDKLFSHLLFDENINIKKRIFMTATERRYRGNSEEIVSMDNEEVYGDTFELMSFKEALECKPTILSDYKIITVVVEKNEIKELIKKNVFLKPKKGKWNDDIEAQSLTALVALRKAMIKHPIKHAVTFHNTIAKAKVFEENNHILTKAIHSFNPIDTFHITGAFPTSIRSKIITEFAESKKALITNARCLTEGVDVPNIDCVLFADAKNSVIDIVQATGRALRKSKGKEFGYIILPILTEKVYDNLIIDDKSYETIILTLRALSSNDERIIEWFGDRKKKKKRKGKLIHIEIDEQLAQSIDLEKFKESIELKIWDKLGNLDRLPFIEARQFVHSLKLKNNKEWRKFKNGNFSHLPKLPSNIPIRPDYYYKLSGWKGWGDWLGTGNIGHGNFIPYEEAKKFVHQLKLTSEGEWRKYSKGEMTNLPLKPDNIPASPNKHYKNKGWKGMGDWLGTGNIANFNKKYALFEDARKFAQSLNLKSNKEWRRYCKGESPNLPPKPENIPNTPSKVYKNKGWNGVTNWLGNEIEYLSFEEAREFVHKLGLKSFVEWRKYGKGEFTHLEPQPLNIPKQPHTFYNKSGWSNWGDWLGTGNKWNNNLVFLPFEEARIFAQSLNLKSNTEWKKYCKGELPNLPPKPENIPNTPSQVYKNKGWNGFLDWLGIERKTYNILAYKFSYMPFEEARKFAQSLNLKSNKEWRRYCKGELPNLPPKLENIPSTPSQVYKNKGWLSFGDWLGTGRIATYYIEYAPFEEARKFAQSLNLKSNKEWRRYCKGELPNLPPKPENIPNTPSQVYKNKGWNGFLDWLGNEITYKPKKQVEQFEIAKLFVHSLNLKSNKEWRKYCRGEFPNLPERPDNIPTNPNRSYKNKGWEGWQDWLGTK